MLTTMWLSRCFRKKEVEIAPHIDLTTPANIIRLFEEDSFKCLETLLDLFLRDPAIAKIALIELATDWKRRPEHYYKMESFQLLVADINAKLQYALLNPETQKIYNLFIDGNMESLSNLVAAEKGLLMEREAADINRMFEKYVGEFVVPNHHFDGNRIMIASGGKPTVGFLIGYLWKAYSLRALCFPQIFNRCAKYLAEEFIVPIFALDRTIPCWARLCTKIHLYCDLKGRFSTSRIVKYPCRFLLRILKDFPKTFAEYQPLKNCLRKIYIILSDNQKREELRISLISLISIIEGREGAHYTKRRLEPTLR